MRFSIARYAVVSMFLWGSATSTLVARQGLPGAEMGASTPEQVISSVYKLVSSEAGKTPDWNLVRSVFLENAVVVLRVSRDSTAVFSLQGFIDDFVRFYSIPAVQKNGFTEKVVRMKPMVIGNIAHILVLYEAHVPGTARPPQQGVDSWELVKVDGKWKIACVTNEIPSKERPLPRELAE